MKKHLFFILCLMALAFSTLPAVANDYLKIHFKDGHTERHYLKLVDNITTSKYDMEGNLHDDYQTQRLVISGTTYTYPLADIDSISYHKVDEEIVKSNVESIYNIAAPIFEQCPTIDEMAEYVDDLKKIEGVEDVWRSDRDIIIKVRDWYDIVLMYPVEPEKQNQSFVRGLESNIKTITQQIKNTKYDGTPLKVAIAHQMGNDPRFEEQRNDLIELKENILAMGLDAVYIPSEEGGDFDLDFYRRRMFDYDIVIIDTHGGYNEKSKIHRFLTGLNTPTNVTIWNGVDYLLDKYDWMDPIDTDLEDTYIGLCQTGYLSWGSFIGVTENFIAKSQSKFAEGPHIVFNAACYSLKGDDILTRTHGSNTKTYAGSDAVARIFHDKGADIYLGYNNTCTQSGIAAYNYVKALLSGCSHESALNYIPSSQHDETEYQASLIDVINPKKSQFDFLVKTHTLEKSIDDIINEYADNNEIEILGSTLSMDPNIIEMGFEVSTNSDFSDSKKIYEIILKQQVNEGGGNALFNTNLTDIKPGETYYYRAFTYDGIHYNWGEERSLTITPLRLSTNLLSLEAGVTQTVNITSGLGNYKVESSDEDIATAYISETTISINALRAGDATITVTDKSGQTATVKVTVTEESIDTPAEAIDLGLPSGTLWASWNLGATKPEEFGGYFAWGETKRKEIYDLNTYQNWNDANGDGQLQPGELLSSYIIAGTKYDAATANWGAEWYTPTYKQIEELLYNTTSEWVTENGVDGRRFTSNTNGNSIFLPVAGYWSSTEDNADADCYGARYLFISESYAFCNGDSPDRGYFIRPVKGSPLPNYSYERDQLIELYNSTDGDSWIQNDNWCSSQSPGHWYGITYEKYNEHVEYINLANNNLTGSISIKGFEKLYNIDIKGNNISSLTIDSCPTLDLGYGFRLDDITLDFLHINNCFNNLGQHFMENANIKKILFTNFQNCGRIFLKGVVSDEVVIKDCVFYDDGVEAEDNSAVKTMIVENSTIGGGLLGGEVDELIIKNCTIGDWWVIGAKSSITIINSYIEGHLVDCSGTPDEVSQYVYSVIR